MWLIAQAALAGAVIVRSYWHGSSEDVRTSCLIWTVSYPDGQISKHFKSRGEASAVYLLWWFSKQGMHPWARVRAQS